MPIMLQPQTAPLQNMLLHNPVMMKTRDPSHYLHVEILYLHIVSFLIDCFVGHYSVKLSLTSDASLATPYIHMFRPLHAVARD